MLVNTFEQVSSTITSYQRTETLSHSNFSMGQPIHPEFSSCLFALTDKAAGNKQWGAVNGLSTRAHMEVHVVADAANEVLGQIGLWHLAEVFAVVTAHLHPLSGWLSEHSSFSRHNAPFLLPA